MAPIPAPEAGLVVRYDYLWVREFVGGRQSSKDRPACVMLAAEVADADGLFRVYLAPITHSPPAPDAPAIALPVDEKRRLGLDETPSWLLLSEVNVDIWPQGLTNARGARAGIYGRLSQPLFRRAVLLLAQEMKAGRLRRIPRP